MYAIFRGNKRATWDIKPEPTLAEGIAIAKPARGAKILSSDYAGEREAITIKEDDIEPARNFLASRGFYIEHTTAAIYAAYRKLRKIAQDRGQKNHLDVRCWTKKASTKFKICRLFCLQICLF